MNIIENSLKIKINKIAIICSRWNDDVNDKLIFNAEKELLELGVNASNIDLFRTPGALEIPRMAKILCIKGEYDAIICLGTLLNNSLTFQFKGFQITEKLLNINMELKTPVINAVIMTETKEEALNLADEKGINYGAMAVKSAIELISLEKR